MTSILLKNGNWNWILPKIEEETLKIRCLTIIQGIVYGLLIVGVVTCVSFMPIGDATTLMYTSPLITMILAAVFLGHQIRLYRILNALLLILGENSRL